MNSLELLAFLIVKRFLNDNILRVRQDICAGRSWGKVTDDYLISSIYLMLLICLLLHVGEELPRARDKGKSWDELEVRFFP